MYRGLVMVAVLAGASPALASNLEVTSFPAGAEIELDGVPTGKRTPDKINVGHAPHVVRLAFAASGWQPATIAVASGQREVHAVLLPIVRDGAIGPPGPQGAAGPVGPRGVDGVSVVGMSVAPGDLDCPYGGAAFISATGTNFACNGAPGPEGPRGATGPAGGAAVSQDRFQGRFALYLDGVFAGALASVEGCHLVLGAPVAGRFGDRRPVDPEPCTVRVGLDASPVFAWIAGSLTGTGLYHDVQIVRHEVGRSTAIRAVNAFLLGWSIPPVDVSSAEGFFVTVRFQPERLSPAVPAPADDVAEDLTLRPLLPATLQSPSHPGLQRVAGLALAFPRVANDPADVSFSSYHPGPAEWGTIDLGVPESAGAVVDDFRTWSQLLTIHLVSTRSFTLSIGDGVRTLTIAIPDATPESTLDPWPRDGGLMHILAKANGGVALTPGG